MQGGIKNKDFLYPDLSYKIVGILFEVNNSLGPGMKEKHYQKGIEIAFSNYGIEYVAQCPYIVRFKNKIIGRYYMDFVVEGKIVVEIKRSDYFSYNNIKQLVRYLRATKLQLGILASFALYGVRYKRIVNIY